MLEVNDAGTSDVYDLTVLGRSEFVANGILVSNCYDALRYLVCGLMLRTPTVTKRGPGAPRTTTAAASRAAF